MNTMYRPNLLRRTTAAIAAVAAFLMADTAAAQSSITLSGVTGNTCNYNSMTVAPNGVFTVNCANATPATPGSAGIFSLSAATLTLQVSTSSSSLFVIRSAGTTDSISVAYTIEPAAVSPSCTAVAAGTLTFGAGSSATQAIPVAATANLGTCTVTLTGVTTNGTVTAATAPTLSSVASQLAATVNVIAGPAPGSCPTPPADMVVADLGPTGAVIKPSLESKRIVSFPLPTLPTTVSSGKIRIGQTPTTPGSSFLEYSISKCPGVIEKIAGCYNGSYIPNYAEMIWFYKPAGSRGQAWVAANGSCWAPTADGPYYLNARWTYAFSPHGTGAYVFQWGGGGY